MDYMTEGRGITDTDEILGIISNSKEGARTEFARLNHEFPTGSFLDIGEDKENSESNVVDYINDYLSEKELSIEDLKVMEFKSERDELVRLLIEKSNLSRRGIAGMLGLNREMVRRVLVSRDLSP